MILTHNRITPVTGLVIIRLMGIQHPKNDGSFLLKLTNRWVQIRWSQMLVLWSKKNLKRSFHIKRQENSWRKLAVSWSSIN